MDLVKAPRNQSIEFLRMLFAMVVVFEHIPFPGAAGKFFSSLIWFAVPYFMIVTGYFSYGATCSQLWTRMKHIFQLIVLSDLTYIVWHCVQTELQGGSTVVMLRALLPDANQLSLWLVFQLGIFQRYLWYLWAVELCYLIQLGYTAFFQEQKPEYKNLYFAGFCLFAAYGVLALLMPAANLFPEEILYRNGWLTGLPMFLLGLWLRQYGHRLLLCLKGNRWKLLGVAVLCVLFALFQNFFLEKNTTPFSMPLGITAIVLLAIQCPKILPEGCRWSRWLTKRLGPWSAGIFLFHMTASGIAGFLLESALPEGTDSWWFPLLVLGITMAMTLVWDACSSLWKRCIHTDSQSK